MAKCRLLELDRFADCSGLQTFLTMSGASLGGLDPAGWACNEDGEIKNGEPQCKEGKDEDEDEDEDEEEGRAVESCR
jgi:hypothetical protein